MGQGIIQFENHPSVFFGAAVCGGLEGAGPRATHFDLCDSDSKFGCDTWEKAESEMIRCCMNTLLNKAKLREDQVEAVFCGDLTNQCTSCALGLNGFRIPLFGLYGACSTFALAMGLAASQVNANALENGIAMASSHFCTAERQYRYPLEYGSQKTPTAQNTVTACGAILIGKNTPSLPYISSYLPGIICDRKIKDSTHMGAAMAPACADTLIRYFQESKMDQNAFDMILTGDLGFYGLELLREICLENGLKLGDNLFDCGLLIYDRERQSVGAGGSGCGCSASVVSGYILDRFFANDLKDVLFIGTGALLSATSVLQGETIPGIAHLIRIRKG